MILTRGTIDGVLRRSPAQVYFHRRAIGSLAVLAYHDIREPDRFARQLDHLRRSAHPVALAEVADAAEGRGGLPPRPVLITFDDGHRDLLEIAMPMLRERQMPAAAFVVAGLVDTSMPHWWTEVKELAAAGGTTNPFARLSPDDLASALKRVPDAERLSALTELRRTASRAPTPVRQLTSADLRYLESAGIAIGNHSFSHPCLSRCTPEKVVDEIERSHRALSSALGHEPGAFAYPDGDRDDRSAAVLAATGYRAAFLFDHRLSSPHPLDPLAISRLRVDAYGGFDRFRIIVSGLHPQIHHLRRRW